MPDINVSKEEVTEYLEDEVIRNETILNQALEITRLNRRVAALETDLDSEKTLTDWFREQANSWSGKVHALEKALQVANASAAAVPKNNAGASEIYYQLRRIDDLWRNNSLYGNYEHHAVIRALSTYEQENGIADNKVNETPAQKW